MLVLYGTGNNGKSTLMKQISEIVPSASVENYQFSESYSQMYLLDEISENTELLDNITSILSCETYIYINHYMETHLLMLNAKKEILQV